MLLRPVWQQAMVDCLPAECTAARSGSRKLASIRCSSPSRRHSHCRASAFDSGGYTPPWETIFDLRERDMFFGDAEQGALVKMFAARELGMDSEAVEEQLHALAALLPDIGSKVKDLSPSLLATLLKDRHKVAQLLVQLREYLPHANVSQMVSRKHTLLTLEAGQIIRAVEDLSQLMQLDPKSTQRLVSDHPGFLDVEGVQDALKQMEQYLPGRDPRRTLVADPSWLLRVQRGTKHLGAHPDT